jgi:acetyl coenzyme A synthetase (ADP forming)-like protein
MVAELPEGYPRHRVVDVGLRDGSTMRVRPVLPEDLPGVRAFFDRLSVDSTRMRFHGLRHPSEKDLRGFVEVDYHDTFGLVAQSAAGESSSIQALATYVRTQETHAEIAIAVADECHGKGLGSLLTEHLSEAARDAGIDTFEAEVLGSNAAMLEVLRHMELPLHTSMAGGEVHVEFPTSLTSQAIAAFEDREATAARASVDSFLHPRTLAVIGASRTRGSIGAAIFRNLLEMGFSGPVFPVNPKADVVQSVKAYPTVLDVPGPVDLAVIVVPADGVVDVAEQCAEKGVRSLLIISAGFAEAGPDGEKRQAALMEVVRRSGMRVIGPNCMGLMNLNEEVRLNATFSPVTPNQGRLAFSSQSGALGIAVMQRALDLGLGLSSFVSVGNKADISGNDLLQYWESDEDTDVILLYLESFGNPRKFSRIARRISKEKPIVAVKSGRTASGARAAASHTGSLAAGDVAVTALFRQAGVIRTDTLEELFDVAALLAHQPLPKGDRVGILTNGGGLGILCADACEAAGLQVPTLSESSIEALRHFLPAEAGTGNPVDMIASATADQYSASLKVLAQDTGLDSIIVIFVPPLVTRPEDVAAALMRTVGEFPEKTFLACFLGVHGVHDHLHTPEGAIPSYTFPESAARALAHVAEHARWCERPEGEIPVFDDVDRGGALSYAAGLLDEGERWLGPEEVEQILSFYGIRTARSRVVAGPSEVNVAAAEIGGPVAVKIHSERILHKSDVGGVKLNLATPSEAEDAARSIKKGLEQQGKLDLLDGFLVQEMISDPGTELFVGMTLDVFFGPLLACGAGGTLVELMRDVGVRITPLTDVDAAEMLRGLKIYALLEGYRGSPALDVHAAEELLLRLSTMVEDLPQLAELDLNPVIVFERDKGYAVADARIRVALPRPELPRGARTS